jgi:REP-associated tyrosine transposase
MSGLVTGARKGLPFHKRFVEKAGGWYHVTARGNERKSICRDDRDREHFLELLAETVLRFRVRLHCLVLMDNHYHWLLELSEP